MAICHCHGPATQENIALERKHLANDKLLLRGAINTLNIQTSGKNENAIRDSVLSPIAKDILRDQDKMLFKAGVRSKYLFPAPNGEHATQDTMSDHWKRYRVHNGIGHVTPYELRHPFVSVTAGRSNITLAELKSIVGHSKNMDTLGTYGHKLSDEDVRISEVINSAFSDLIK